MRKRDELTNPAGCMVRARDDEMTFVLLGRDAAAPVAIRAWIAERVRIEKNRMDDPQIIEAEQCARVMEAERIQAIRGDPVERPRRPVEPSWGHQAPWGAVVTRNVAHGPLGGPESPAAGGSGVGAGGLQENICQPIS